MTGIWMAEINPMGSKYQQQYVNHVFHTVLTDLLFSSLRLKTEDVVHIFLLEEDVCHVTQRD